ncbi:MAG: hypothetical protein V3W41_21840 [Planctomycetota bacterium]
MSDGLNVNPPANSLMAAADYAAKKGLERLKANSTCAASAFPQLVGCAYLASAALCFFAVTNAYSVMMRINQPKDTS